MLNMLFYFSNIYLVFPDPVFAFVINIKYAKSLQSLPQTLIVYSPTLNSLTLHMMWIISELLFLLQKLSVEKKKSFSFLNIKKFSHHKQRRRTFLIK